MGENYGVKYRNSPSIGGIFRGYAVSDHGATRWIEAKYVVSSTLEHPDWNNSRVLKGDVVNEVSKLKQELDGEIVVPASYQLGRTLMEHDLVDELRVVVFPVVLGAGERFFGETSDKKPMRLVSTRTIGDSLVFLTYEFLARDG